MPKKGAAGAGTIRKKTVIRSGKQYTYWEARYTAGTDPGTGRQIQRSITGKTQKEVAQRLREATAALDSGTYIPPSKMTTGQWLDTWAAEYLEGVKPRTRTLYTRTINLYLKPAIGSIKLDVLTSPTIQRLYNSLLRGQDGKQGLSPKTVHNIHGTLHKALQQAVKAHLIRFNPAAADCVELPPIEQREIHPLDEKSIVLFVQAVKGRPFETLYLVALFTGMRQGELLGLQWDAIDFEHGKIHVFRQLQKVEGHPGEYRLISPKNRKGRVLSPAPFVMDLLRRHWTAQTEQRLKVGPLWKGEDFVFCNELGSHLSPRTIYNHFKRIVRAIGLPETRFHDLRHTYATAALENGDNVKAVQAALGHHSAAFTLETYTHTTDRMMQESAAHMESFIQEVMGL